MRDFGVSVKNILFRFGILGLILILIGLNVYRYSKYSIKDIGELPEPKLCSSLFLEENKLIISGGYDELNNQSSSNMQIFDLKTYRFMNSLDINFDKTKIIKKSDYLPELFELSMSLYSDYDSLVIVDKTALDSKILWKSFNPNNYNGEYLSERIRIPKNLQNADLKQVFKLDDVNLIFVFTNASKVYIARYYAGKSGIEILAKFNLECKYSDFILVPDKNINTVKIIVVGGMKTLNSDFVCGNELPADAQICNQIKEITVKL